MSHNSESDRISDILEISYCFLKSVFQGCEKSGGGGLENLKVAYVVLSTTKAKVAPSHNNCCFLVLYSFPLCVSKLGLLCLPQVVFNGRLE